MDSTSMLDAAIDLAPTVTARAAEAERDRSVPADVIADLGAAGILRMYVPKSLGGPEVDPLTALEIVETLSAADGSTGWTAFILNTSFFTSWLEPSVARELLGSHPGSGMAGLFGPLGRAVPEEPAAFRVDGRWPFNSGSVHASWFCEGAFVFDPDGAMRMLPEGRPDWRFVFAPKDDVEILDTWHVTGLRGTASHDVTMTGVLVPEERTASPMFEAAPHDAAHFRWSFFALLSSLMTGFPLGVARRALDELTTVVATKSRGGTAVLADTEVVALAIAQAEGALRAARAFAHDAVGRAWDRSLAGDPLTLADRIEVRMAALHAMRTGREAVDRAFALGGGGALFDDNVLQRCWRDINAGSHHIFFSDDQTVRTGRMLLDRPTEPWFF